jgi:hypothetical protein
MRGQRVETRRGRERRGGYRGGSLVRERARRKSRRREGEWRVCRVKVKVKGGEHESSRVSV